MVGGVRGESARKRNSQCLTHKTIKLSLKEKQNGAPSSSSQSLIFNLIIPDLI